MSDRYYHTAPHPDPIQEHWLPLGVAIQEIAAFETRFGEKHLLLACHAALPSILTPELLNLIHLNFLEHERIPWIAEADFLLSPLCRQIDDTLFEVEPRVREALLMILECRSGRAKLVEIADFLLAYLEKQQELRKRIATTTTIRWIALAYLSPDKAVNEMRFFLQKSLAPEPPHASDLLSQLLIVTTMEMVAEPLEQTTLQKEYRSLIYSSRVLAELLYRDGEAARQDSTQQRLAGQNGEQGTSSLSSAIQQWLGHDNEETPPAPDSGSDKRLSIESPGDASADHIESKAPGSSETSLDDGLKDSSISPASPLEETQGERIMDGDLQTLGLQSILKMLALSGKTGKLSVHSDPGTLSIFLSKGQIVALHEEGVPQLQPDLLNMLCLINKLQFPQAQIVHEMAQGDQELALAILAERGWMSPAEMQQRLEFAVVQSISHALRWVNGRFAFYRYLVPMGSKMHPLDVDSVLLEASLQADEWEKFIKEDFMQLSRTTVARWQPEVSIDVRNLGLSQESIEILCLCNGEIPLQSIALALMMPEARIARIMTRLLELNLVEVVDRALETELQQDLVNLMLRSQYLVASYRDSRAPEHLLLGLIKVLVEYINGLLIHHGKYAKSLRGRGQVPLIEINHYLEHRFAQPLQLMARQQYPLLETVNFVHGRLDCSDILALNKLVKGEGLTEFYREAMQGLKAFLREIFATILRDEINNSSTRRQLTASLETFLNEIDREAQPYHLQHRATAVAPRPRMDTGLISARSLIDEQALPGWMRENQSSLISARSLIDEQALPGWMRENQSSTTQENIMPKEDLLN